VGCWRQTRRSPFFFIPAPRAQQLAHPHNPKPAAIQQFALSSEHRICFLQTAHTLQVTLKVIRRSVLHVLRTKENAVADLTRLSESDPRFSFIHPSDHRYAAFYQYTAWVYPCVCLCLILFRYVVLATAAVAQKEADKTNSAAATTASSANDPSALPSSPAKATAAAAVPAAETASSAVSEAVDPELSAEAVKLRRKRLEVNADTLRSAALAVAAVASMLAERRAALSLRKPNFTHLIQMLKDPQNVCLLEPYHPPPPLYFPPLLLSVLRYPYWFYPFFFFSDIHIYIVPTSFFQIQRQSTQRPAS
jgi:hypothetical protein